MLQWAVFSQGGRPLPFTRISGVDSSCEVRRLCGISSVGLFHPTAATEAEFAPATVACSGCSVWGWSTSEA